MGNKSSKSSPIVVPEVIDTISGDIIIAHTSPDSNLRKVSPLDNNVSSEETNNTENTSSSLVFYERASREVVANNLISMCKQGKLAVVMDLINKGCDVNIKGMWNTTPLITACQYNHESIMLLLLEVKGIDINHANSKGGVALTYACLEGMRDGVEVLLDKGANPAPPEVVIFNGKTDTNDFLAPLSAAVINGHTSVVCSLLRLTSQSHVLLNMTFQQYSSVGSGSQKNILRGVSALMLACKHGHVDIIKVLLREDFNCYALDSENSNLLHFAAKNSKHSESVFSLLRELEVLNTELVSMKDSRGDTPLHICCDSKNVAAASILLGYFSCKDIISTEEIEKDRGATQSESNSNNNNEDISATLIQAAWRGRQSRVSAASHRDGQVEARGAVSSGAVSFSRASQNIMGKTPLHLAVKKRSVELVNLLLEHDFDPMVRDADGVSPLDMASLLPTDSPILDLLQRHVAAKREQGVARQKVGGVLLQAPVFVQMQVQELQTEETALTVAGLRSTTPPSSSQVEVSQVEVSQVVVSESQHSLSSTHPITPPSKTGKDSKSSQTSVILRAPPSRQEMLEKRSKAAVLVQTPVFTLPRDDEEEKEQPPDMENPEVEEKTNSLVEEEILFLEPPTLNFATPTKSDGTIVSPEYTSGAKLNTAPIYSGTDYKGITSAPKKLPSSSGRKNVSNSSSKSSVSPVILRPAPSFNFAASSKLLIFDDENGDE